MSNSILSLDDMSDVADLLESALDHAEVCEEWPGSYTLATLRRVAPRIRQLYLDAMRKDVTR